MKVSREQVAENRRNILTAAAALFRERGIEAVSVAEVMKQAGLTHGGFYGHFKSKDDLVVQAIAFAAAETEKPGLCIEQYARNYLSDRHAFDRSAGCLFAALGTDAARQSPEARRAMTDGMRRIIENLTEASASRGHAETKPDSIVAFATLLGAVVMARVSDDPALAQDVLVTVRSRMLPRD
jgi:TetR/AcrR family transcriptional regulator, transcriptional repressor for nem operon